MTDPGLLEQWEGVELPTLLHACRWGPDLDSIWYRLRNDQTFAVEMRLCKEWRIPHSEFLSWKPEDQDKAVAHMAFEGMRCGGCGIHPTDWPDPDEPTFEATSKFCPGCAELARFNRWAQSQAEDHKDALDGQQPYLKRVGEP